MEPANSGLVLAPPAFDFLLGPGRYKVPHGGRGSAKSWSVARVLLGMGAIQPLRILCAREFQASIADSVHQLLSDQIDELGLTNEYTITQREIVSRCGTLFIFRGLHVNPRSVKSIEGIDICWVEEADTLSKETGQSSFRPSEKRAQRFGSLSIHGLRKTRPISGS